MTGEAVLQRRASSTCSDRSKEPCRIEQTGFRALAPARTWRSVTPISPVRATVLPQAVVLMDVCAMVASRHLELAAAISSCVFMHHFKTANGPCPYPETA